MRLSGAAKRGFYPAHPLAIEQFVKHLREPLTKSWCLLDPCAGEGLAVGQIARLLDCPMDSVYAIELDETRAEKVRENLPGARIMAPCSAFGTTISASSLSIIFCNAPFDSDELGGGARVEAQFLDSVTKWLVPKGVLAFACPKHVVDQHDVCRLLMSHYERIAILEWPESVRQYEEVTVLAVKRVKPVDWSALRRYDAFIHEAHVLSGNFAPYDIPGSKGPRKFEKSDMTEREYIEAMSRSPLMRHLRPLPEPPLARPPLSLGTGHWALLLSAGHLDGLVEPEGEPPHVVRGTARKTKYLVSEDVESTKNSRTTKQVYSERISLAVRVLTSDGIIQTFGDLESQAADVTNEPEDGDGEYEEIDPDES